MSVPSTVTDLSATAALNSPAGSESIGTNLDDYLRAHAAIIRQVSDAKANSGANADITSLSGISGNLAFTGTGNRITGDFSNATIANRVMFQTSTVNSITSLNVVPNGTGVGSEVVLFSNVDPSNSSYAAMTTDNTAMTVIAGKIGTGTYLPLRFSTSGSERLRIDTSGNVLVTGGGGLGYGTGSGGTVTQATSKSTAVTLNKPSGQILMNNAALASGASVTFVVNNSFVTLTDGVNVWPVANGSYVVTVTGIFSGQFQVRVTNMMGGSLSEALPINFQLAKGANT